MQMMSSTAKKKWIQLQVHKASVFGKLVAEAHLQELMLIS